MADLDAEHPQVLHSKSLHKIMKNSERIATALEDIANSLHVLAHPPIQVQSGDWQFSSKTMGKI